MEDYLVIYNDNDQFGELIVPAVNRLSAEETFMDIMDNGLSDISQLEIVRIMRL